MITGSFNERASIIAFLIASTELALNTFMPRNMSASKRSD